MVMPSKLSSERTMFTVAYGDLVPWGAVATGARIQVEVLIGVDAHPQRVFARVVAINGSDVIFQVRLGLPGVIYVLRTGIQVGTDWYEREFRLAILPDSASIVPLYPLIESFTSLLWPQFMLTSVSMDAKPTGGVLRQLVLPGKIHDSVSLGALPTTGALIDARRYGILDFDDVTLGVIPTAGTLRQVVMYGLIEDSVSLAVIPANGALKPNVKGVQKPDEVSLAVVPTGGSLYV